MTNTQTLALVDKINLTRKRSNGTIYTFTDSEFDVGVKGCKTRIYHIRLGNRTGESPSKLSVKDYKLWLFNWLTGTV